MLLRVVKTTVCTMLRNRRTTVLSICGLALGMCCTILISLYIQYDLSCDSIHSKRDLIYQLLLTGETQEGKLEETTSIPTSLVNRVESLARLTPQKSHNVEVSNNSKTSIVSRIGKTIQGEASPELSEVTDRTGTSEKSFAEKYPQLRYREPIGAQYLTEVLRFCHLDGLLYKDKQVTDLVNVSFAENGFFDVFDFPLHLGDRETVFTRPGSLVLSSRAASTYFQGVDPLGKTVEVAIHGTERMTLKITGVAAPIPHNTTLRFDFLANVPFERLQSAVNGKQTGKVANLYPSIYVLFGKVRKERQQSILHNLIQDLFVWQSPVNVSAVAANFNRELSKISYEEVAEDFLNSDYKRLQLTSVPLNSSHFARDRFSLSSLGERLGDKQKASLPFFFFLFLVGALVLTVACVNTITLSTARLGLRSKEIAVRKVAGAEKRDLALQFFFESTLLCAMAVLLGLALTELLLPMFNLVMERTLILDYGANWQFLLIIMGITLVAGVLSGIYPAIYLSSLPLLPSLFDAPIKPAKLGLRYLIVFQLTASLTILTLSLFLSNESRFLQSRPVGFNTDNLLFFKVDGDALSSDYYDLRTQLLKRKEVEGVAISSIAAWEYGEAKRVALHVDITKDKGMGKRLSHHDKQPVAGGAIQVDPAYLDLYGISYVGAEKQGSWAALQYPSCVINKVARIHFGAAPLLGKTIQIDGRSCKVLGITEGFNFAGPWQLNEPLIMEVSETYPNDTGYISIKLTPSGSGETPVTAIPEIQNLVENYFPNSPFVPRSVKREIEQIRSAMDYDWEAILQYASFVSILLTALGLYSFSEHEVKRKAREFAIRKALGASGVQVCINFAYSFIPLIVLASSISWGISLLTIPKVLAALGFPRSFLMSLPVFMFSCSATLFATLCIVGYQVFKAASIDPASTLRDQ